MHLPAGTYLYQSWHAFTFLGMYLPVWVCLACHSMRLPVWACLTCQSMHLPVWACTTTSCTLTLSIQVVVVCITLPTPVQRSSCTYFVYIVQSIRQEHTLSHSSCTEGIACVHFYFVYIVHKSRWELGSISLRTPLQFIKQIFNTCTEM